MHQLLTYDVNFARPSCGFLGCTQCLGTVFLSSRSFVILVRLVAVSVGCCI